jgi:hypothetical protein
MPITVTARAESSADTDEYTFSGQALGDAASDRYILIGVSAREADSNLRTFESVAVAGNAASPISGAVIEAGEGQIGFFGVELPAGTSGDVVVTFNAANSRCSIAVYRVVGADPTTPTDTAADSSDVETDINLDISLNVVDGGVIAAYAFGATVATLDIDYNSTLTDGTQQSVEVLRANTGIHDASATETPRTVTAAFDTTGGDIFGPRAVAVSFPPAVDDEPVLDAEPGAFALSGDDAGLIASLVLDAEAATFALVGEDATLNAGDALAADAGAFVLSGQDTDLIASLVLHANAGAFVLAGQAIGDAPGIIALGLEEAMIAKLLATTAVTDLVSTRVYPGSVPQASTMPAIVVNRISGTPIYTDDGESGLQTARLELDCWGETYSSAKTVARAVIAALSGFVGTVDDVDVRNTLLDAERDFREGGGNAAKYLFRTNLDFIIWFEI